jgi:hypothetical protein
MMAMAVPQCVSIKTAGARPGRHVADWSAVTR